MFKKLQAFCLTKRLNIMPNRLFSHLFDIYAATCFIVALAQLTKPEIMAKLPSTDLLFLAYKTGNKTSFTLLEKSWEHQ